MKQFGLLLMALCLFLGEPPRTFAEVRVFACEQEWGALAKELGGEKVEVFSATTARQDPHYMRAKPSLIAAVRNADLIVCSGANLEIGWLPLLLQKSGSETTQPGGSGYLLAADYIQTLEKPSSVDRSGGDIHPEGNPHLHLNPHNILVVAIELNKRLKSIDQGNSTDYQKRFEEFTEKWTKAISSWEAEAKSLHGKEVVVHHKSFTYLLDWLGMREVATLEPKPGIPPTTSHLESLLQSLRSTPPSFILRTPFNSEDASDWLSNKLGIPVVLLPYTVGGNDQSSDLFGLFQSTISQLNAAVKGHVE